MHIGTFEAGLLIFFLVVEVVTVVIVLIGARKK